MRVFSVSDKGPVRKENQDHGEACRLRVPRGAALLVCDGMGGANSGALASTLAAGAFLAHLKNRLSASRKNRMLLPYWMREACAAANAAVYERACAEEAHAGMGTTLVAAVILGKRAEILNVGDSRAYLIRGETITQLTRDHSVVAELTELGKITPEQARIHPNRNLITRAVGVDDHVEPDPYSVQLRRGDRLLLCSDGLSNTLEDDELLAVCRRSRDAAVICRTLVETAVARGAGDNVTAAAAVVESL